MMRDEAQCVYASGKGGKVTVSLCYKVRSMNCDGDGYGRRIDKKQMAELDAD